MGLHRLYIDGVLKEGEVVVIAGDEAKHAVRVKRLEAGDSVQLLDGVGTVAEGVIEERGPDARKGEWVVPVRVRRVEHAEPVRPALHVLAATPKGARLDELIDELSQVGAASWSPLETERGVVDPRETKLARVERLAVEASKQCGRAWVLRTGPKKPLGEALQGDDGPVIVADASGEAYARTGAGVLRLLIGPEGGWTSAELAAARQAGALVCAFGPHAMRIETAAVVAAGIILAAERGGT